MSQQIKLYVTTDYNIFRGVLGNRPIDQLHVNRLKKKFEAEGNLTSDFPINVNENMEIIDGQHRILALKELGFPVYYTESKGANLATIRQINVGRKNWGWKDNAASHAAEGNMNYKDILDFSDVFGFAYHTLISYCNGGKRFDNRSFNDGDFKILDKGLAFKLFNQLTELRSALPFRASRSFDSAVYDLLTHPEYDQKRMVAKLTKYGTQLKEWSRKKDWLRNLEDIYNVNQTEATSVRFF